MHLKSYVNPYTSEINLFLKCLNYLMAHKFIKNLICKLINILLKYMLVAKLKKHNYGCNFAIVQFCKVVQIIYYCLPKT